MKKSQLKQIIREILNEELALENSASDDAKRQGLTYMSFGRWGRDGKVTHVSKDGRLAKVDQQRKTEPTRSWSDFKSPTRQQSIHTKRTLDSLADDEKQISGALINDPRFAEMYKSFVDYSLPRSWAANKGWADDMESDEDREQLRVNSMQRISTYIEDRVDNPETAKKLTAMFTDPNVDLSRLSFITRLISPRLPKAEPLASTSTSARRDAVAQKELRQWLKTAKINYNGKEVFVIDALTRGGAAREAAKIAVRDKKVSLGLASGRK